MHSNTYMHIIPASLDPRPFPPLVLQTAKTGSGNGLGMRLGSKTLRFRVYWELVVIVEHSNVVTVVHVWLSIGHGACTDCPAYCVQDVPPSSCQYGTAQEKEGMLYYAVELSCVQPSIHC